MEAVVENLAVKQKVFSDLAAHCSPETILATNTSSISISKIAASAVKSGDSPADRLKSTSRAVGIHWMQPVPVMKLVGTLRGSCACLADLDSSCHTELILALQTSEEVRKRSHAFAEACGKQVTTSADTPGRSEGGLCEESPDMFNAGFLANRILLPYINEAIICLETVCHSESTAGRAENDKTGRRLEGRLRHDSQAWLRPSDGYACAA